MTIYKLRCKRTQQYLADYELRMILRERTSGRNWKNKTAPISMIKNLLGRIYDGVIRSDGAVTFEQEAASRYFVPVELVTLEDDVIVNVEDVDYEPLKKKVLDDVINDNTTCHKIYLADYMSGKIKKNSHYCHAIMKPDNISDKFVSIAELNHLLRKEISKLGLSRTVKVIVHSDGFNYRADMRFDNENSQLLLKLGCEIDLTDFRDMDPTLLRKELERLNRIFGLAM